MNDAKGKLIITVTSPVPLTVAMIIDGIKDNLKAYAFEEGITNEIEIKEVNDKMHKEQTFKCIVCEEAEFPCILTVKSRDGVLTPEYCPYHDKPEWIEVHE